MANKEKNFASAVIYVHNAENRITRFLSTIIEIMENNFEHSDRRDRRGQIHPRGRHARDPWLARLA